MTIAARLEELRRDHPGCRLAAFADLSAGMILASSADPVPPQERLDRLCTAATELLAGESAARMAEVCNAGKGGWPTHAIAIDGAEINLFLRSEHEPSDALCCIVDTARDLELFLSDARRNLDAISGAQ